MTGHSAHHNTLSDCIFGLDLFNSVDALAYNNTIERTQVGVRLVGVARFELYQNTISQSGLRGINLANAHDGLIRDNMLCANPTAIRYGQGAADRYGFGPSDNNTIRQNTFPSTGAGIVDEDPAPGSGNTEVKNVFGGCS
jgi:nitrous oxidase accessory protein NosD